MRAQLLGALIALQTSSVASYDGAFHFIKNFFSSDYADREIEDAFKAAAEAIDKRTRHSTTTPEEK